MMSKESDPDSCYSREELNAHKGEDGGFIDNFLVPEDEEIVQELLSSVISAYYSRQTAHRYI